MGHLPFLLKLIYGRQFGHCDWAKNSNKTCYSTPFQRHVFVMLNARAGWRLADLALIGKHSLARGLGLAAPDLSPD